MGKLLAAAVALFVCTAPTLSSAAPSMGAKPMEAASSGILHEAHYYRHHRHHHYYYRRHHHHHYYWHHRHHRHHW